MAGWRILTNSLWIGGLSLMLATTSYHLWLAAESRTPLRDLVNARSWRWSWQGGVFLVAIGWALSMADARWEKLLWFGLAGWSGLQLIGLFIQAPGTRGTPAVSSTKDAGAPRVCLVAAVPLTLHVFMAPHVRALSRRYQVVLVCSSAPGVAPLLSDRVRAEQIDIGRKVTPFRDLRSLFQLWRLFRREGFGVVHSITPKAGLLTMVAGRMAGVPVRVHWFTGQIWATRTGLARTLLKALDRLLAACATDLLADSQSQRQFLVTEKVVREGQVTVLARGSVCGVDTERFRPDPERRAATRAQLLIPQAADVLLFVGRITRDKGVLELAEAFAGAARMCPTLYLVVVGPDEQSLMPRVKETVRDNADRFRWVGFTPEPERFMAAADIFVLPSYREGFGSSVIEAAACGVPAIGTRVCGLTDAIEESVSGTLVPVGDSAALCEAIVSLSRDADALAAMGDRARRRVEEHFGQDRLTAALEEYYLARRV